MDRELGHKLIDSLYNSGNLSLKECGNKRDKLNKLKENQIEIFLTSLPNAECFLPEIINQISQIKEAEEVKLKMDRELGHKLIRKLYRKRYLTFEDVSEKIDELNRLKQSQIKNFLTSLPGSEVFLDELTIKHEENNRRKVKEESKLFYFTIIITVISIIFFLGVLLIQYGDGEASRIGKSTKDGFIFYAFLITFLAPTILWVIYYLAIKKGPALTKVIKDSRKIKDEKNQVVKRSEVVKQIKEAKELLDLGILTQAEYDELIKKLKPIILNN